MPSERIQRRIDSLLDQAEEAADQEDWPLSVRRAREALALNETNADATLLINAAETMLAGGTPESASTVEAPPPVPQPVAPSSFAGGRYEVREFLGEGGKKRVFLAHDSLLDSGCHSRGSEETPCGKRTAHFAHVLATYPGGVSAEVLGHCEPSPGGPMK